MTKLVNRAKMTTATTGTGTITLGSASSGYQSFAAAGVVNADIVRYVIEDGTAWEIGEGTYTASGTTLTRVVSESSNADAALNLTGSAVVYVSAAAEDIPPVLELYAENPSSPTAPSATGTNAVAIGSESVSSGLRSTALAKSRANGTDSFAAAIANNTATYGATGSSSVAIGQSAKATAPWSFAYGRNSQSTSSYSVVLGGYLSAATKDYAYAFGHRASADVIGKYAYGVFTSADVGTSQGGYYVLALNTTDATSSSLVTNGGTNAASTTNQVILPNNSAYFFSGTIIARQDAASGTDIGAWEIKGAIRREGSAATTTLVKSTIDDFNIPAGWAVALTADTTNGGLAITVTGAAATNIRWVATVNTSEVTY